MFIAQDTMKEKISLLSFATLSLNSLTVVSLEFSQDLSTEFSQNFSIDFFNNLECLPGYACFDTDKALMKNASSETDFKVRNCKDKGILVFENQTTEKYCLPWGMKDYDCGEIGVYDVDENIRYLTFDFDVVFDTRFKIDDDKFSPVVTTSEKIVIQPFKCTYQSKGNMLARDIWSYIPNQVVAEDPLNGLGNFETEFFMTMDKTCQEKSSSISPTQPLYMCIIIVDIEEPDVKIVAKKIWATPGSDPDHEMNRVYFDGACHFERDALGHDIDFGSDTFATGHSKNEATATVVALGVPEKFDGYNTMNYHLDISVCMTEAECPEECEDALSNIARTGTNTGVGGIGNPPVFGRSKFPGVVPEIATNVKMDKISPFQRYRWYKKYNIPLETNSTELYEFIDKRAVELRREFLKNGKRGDIFKLDHNEIVSEFLEIKRKNIGEVRKRRSLSSLKSEKYGVINAEGNLESYHTTDRLFYGPIFIETMDSRLARIKVLSVLLIVFGLAIIFISVLVLVKILTVKPSHK